MANYDALKAAVAAVVKTNGNNEITGANLQSTLFDIIDALGGDIPNIVDNLVTEQEGSALDASMGMYLQKEIEHALRNRALKSWMLENNFAVSDSNGNNVLVLFENGNIKTFLFDTRKTPQAEFSLNDYEVSDNNGYIIMKVSGGHVETENFNSRKVNGEFNPNDFSISDENGYIIFRIQNGDIRTMNFDSSLIRNAIPQGILKYPELPIPFYITNNNLDESNRWGIGSRNKSLNIFLDHFFHTDTELGVKFSDGNTYAVISQKIVGNGNDQGWNNNVTKYEYLQNLNVGDETIPIKVRSILNSETSGIKPIVLQIGDSVTEGWFANYPVVQGAPIESWSWAKFYFEKDKAQKGSGFDSMFVGSRTSNTVNYDGISYKSFAYGWGGKTAKWYCTGNDSPFSSNGVFSLTSYLNAYKTLADDGTTRLVPGSTAGTEVTDATAWDLCTPNIVVVQLGMNDVLTEWKTYMAEIVSNIKTEYPSMKIIISVLDACTCNYPSLYPEYKGIFFDNYNGNHTKLLDAYCYAIDNWQDESNGIYVIYSGAVMPMPYTCNVRETDGSFDGKNKRYVGVDSVERVPHPSRYAHQEIGYLLYSTIKWILTN